MKTRLFSSYKIGSMELKNRISVPPMCQYQASDGFPTTWHKVHYGKLAGSGAALVCVEAMAVSPDGRISGADLGLWSDEHAMAFAEVVRIMREIDSSTKVCVQINHSGRKGSERAPWLGGHLTKEEGGWEPVGPSAIAFGEGCMVPREMLPGGIEAMVQAFANAARRAQQAGVDAIEVHMAHGYLLHQFLSAETIDFVKILKEHGCAFVDVSTGGLAACQTIPVSYGYQLPFARAVRQETGLPTIACGLIKDPRQAESVLVEGTADMVDVGRDMLLNPHWGWMAALKLGEKVEFPPSYQRGMHL